MARWRRGASITKFIGEVPIVSEEEVAMENAGTGIDWDAVQNSLPDSAEKLLDGIRNACQGNSDDPARAVERTLNADIAVFRKEFEDLKGDDDGE